MTAREALALLRLDLPTIRASSDDDCDRQLRAWKDGPLKTAHRAAARRAQGSQSALVDVHAARDVLELLGARTRAPTPTATRRGITVVATAR